MQTEPSSPSGRISRTKHARCCGAEPEAGDAEPLAEPQRDPAEDLAEAWERQLEEDFALADRRAEAAAR